VSDLPEPSSRRDDSLPVVSVVVVFHNTRRYLDEAVQSVLAQTFERWELVLVDDGATDGSDAIAQAHAERDTRIRYVHHPERANRGISASRNLGIREARGRFIAQLDADDVLLPAHLARHVAVLEAHPEAALVYAPVQRWYSWENGDAATRNADFVARPLEGYDELIRPPSLVPVMLQRMYGVPLGFVCRREAMQSVGGYEDEFRGMYDDQVFFVKLALRYPVYVLSGWSYRYRRHPASIVSRVSNSDQRLPNRLRFLDWVSAYLAREQVTDRRVRRAVRQERWKCHHPQAARRRARVVELAHRVRRRLARVLH